MFLIDYLQELVKEPASRCYNKKICLHDYNGKYIHHLNGFRDNIFLPEKYVKTIQFYLNVLNILQSINYYLNLYY